MNGTELRKQLLDLGQAQRDLARKLGINERTVRNWCDGRSTVPPHIALMIKMVRKGHSFDDVIAAMRDRDDEKILALALQGRKKRK